jgi:hypothetical protein
MISSGIMRRVRYILPLLHATLFVLACLLYLSLDEGLLDGKNGLFFGVLWFADVPISVFCFGLLWAGPTALGLVLWGVLGTLWWVLIGWLMGTIVAAHSRRTT